jgi:hypothetical protein
MKILFCTKNDVFGATILNFILPKLRHHEVKVLLSDKTRSEENKVPELFEEKFLERDFPLGVLFPLIDADQPSCGTLLTFEGCAKKYGVPIDTILDINGQQGEQMIRDWAPDVIVSARFSLIFKKNIEMIPRHGIFNIHPGALPGYAGLCAPLRGLLNADEKLGCTLHQVDMGIDTGPIYSVSYMPASPQKSIFSHIGNLYEMGLTRLLELLQTIENGESPVLQVQDPADFRYYRLPDEQVFAELRDKGIEPVSFEIYSQLIQKFCPDAMRTSLAEFITPLALATLTKSIHTHGIEACVERYRTTIDSQLMPSEN